MEIRLAALLKHFQEKPVSVKTGMDTGFPSENVTKQRARAPFRLNRNGKGSSEWHGIPTDHNRKIQG
jgi:hypothetical protein